MRSQSGRSRPRLPENFPELASVTYAAHASHCSHPFPHLGSHSGDLGAWTGHLWGGEGDVSGQPQATGPQSDQEEPRSGPASLACRAARQQRWYSEHCPMHSKDAPLPWVPEGDTPATPHRELTGSLHPLALRPHALPPHLHAPWLQRSPPAPPGLGTQPGLATPMTT